MDLLTIVTPTVGNRSARRLECLCAELRKFTHLPFRHIVGDDGTISYKVLKKQEEVCRHYGSEHIVNDGPNFGASYILNLLFEQAKTPWVYLVDDGVRPSLGWLEAAVDFINKIGNRNWQGHKVGLAGALAIDAVTLAVAGAFPTRLPAMSYAPPYPETYNPLCIEHFYGAYNDGLWNWKRLGPMIEHYLHQHLHEYKMIGTCEEAMRSIYLYRLDPPMDCRDPLFRGKILTQLNPNDMGGWYPQHRLAQLYWYGSPLCLVNRDAWEQVGGWRHGCWLYEGHLSLRLGLAGYLVLKVEMPPWLHLHGQATCDMRESQRSVREPRSFDVDDAFVKDFGHTQATAPVLVDKILPLEERRRINLELAEHPLDIVEGWTL
jgi:GT2 family glycosyltransferase